MCYAALMRFIRRRFVLGIIFASSFTYCVVSLLKENGSSVDNGTQDIILERKVPFIWRTLQEHNETGSELGGCRNSVQGKVLIVDDRGYVCSRADVQLSGCCSVHADNTRQYTCQTCSSRHCCAIYEYCVSCCLHPDKRELLQAVLDKGWVQQNVLFASVSDHFELCLAKCRTNSLSVHHENSYKDPKEKHCFGEHLPGTTKPTNKD